MRKIFMSLAVVGLLFTACNNETAQADVDQEATITNADAEMNTGSESVENGVVSPSMFGEEITVEGVTSTGDLFAQLESSDTVSGIVVSGKINNCCQKKGCWMKVDLGEEKEVFVKFKDYGFFMPLDCEGSTAIMQGKAYAETISVEELQHYAEDAGKSAEEIAAITEPETKYSFMAEGVILKDYVRNETDEPVEGEKAE
ncbi:MAG: DUF4920 domain-containing protein [Salibacteraceae bacterium]